ncbi:MFS transporter [Methylobacterium sp. 2A]|nr:MFS transporter [Methylobacterium sp. 2A]
MPRACDSDPACRSVPGWVFLLGAAIFVVTTAEFIVAGLMPTLAAAFSVTVPETGFLIALFALGMTLGGPIVTALLLALGVPNRPALLWLLGLFLAASTLAALATDYPVLALARTLQGVASAGCFGVAITLCAAHVRPEIRGRAVSVVLAGLMIAPVMGVPGAALISQAFGWRASFWGIVALAALALAAIGVGVPRTERQAGASLAANLGALRSGRLWAAYATSGLIIGATFAAFSYVTAIMTEVGGFSPSAIPLLLAGYGVANVVGNLVVGRLADRYTIPVLGGGLAILATALATFAAFAGNPVISTAAFLAVGLVGVSLNPAMVARVMRAAEPSPLVNSFHTSVITGGLAFGTWAGGAAIDLGLGLTAPLWVGAGLAVLGLLSLAPRRARLT